EGDRQLDGFSLLRARLASWKPGVDQDREVLFVLVLELLDHQLAATCRRAPMDPPWAVAGAIIPKPMVFDLLGRPVMTLALAALCRLALKLKPATGQMSDPGIDEDSFGVRNRDPMLDEPER